MIPCVSVWCLLEYRVTNSIVTQFCSILRQVVLCLACSVTNIITLCFCLMSTGISSYSSKTVMTLCVSVWCQLTCRRIPQRLLWHCVFLSDVNWHVVVFLKDCYDTVCFCLMSTDMSSYSSKTVMTLCVSVWCQLACRRIPQRLLWHCVFLSDVNWHVVVFLKDCYDTVCFCLMSTGMSSYSSKTVMTLCVSVWCQLACRRIPQRLLWHCVFLSDVNWHVVVFLKDCYDTVCFCLMSTGMSSYSSKTVMILCVSVWCQLTCRRIPQRLLWHCVHLSHAHLHKPSLSSTPTPTGGTDARARANTHTYARARAIVLLRKRSTPRHRNKILNSDDFFLALNDRDTTSAPVIPWTEDDDYTVVVGIVSISNEK